MRPSGRGGDSATGQVMKRGQTFWVVLIGAALAARNAPAGDPFDRVSPIIVDRQDSQSPDCVHLNGWVGSRITANEANRLAKLDVDRLLEGYRQRPGRQTWDGEHIGKWLHASTLAWVNTGDAALRAKLDYAVTQLGKCQLADGYLGTYVEAERWTFWDVWAHKYNLLGLLTYMRYTRDDSPLPICRRMADLLCRTFGDEPGQLDLIIHGRHAGLAPTSVLEPMVLLYRHTGEPRYFNFCKYILRAWEQPNGPKVISELLASGRVDRVGDAKAYEMLSCLNGALELYRLTGDEQILRACRNAWRDIVANRLYLTGAASYGELFHDAHDLPNVCNVGETCVTVTWLQFNAQLLRLTGEATFAEQLERVTLNQLFGAQSCDGAGWGYYVQMEGRKPYSSTLDGHCCLSSGPRGVALIPTFAITTDAEGVVMNLYDRGEAKLRLRDGTPVTVTMETRYPSAERIVTTLRVEQPKTFSVKLRIPDWCSRATVQVNGRATKEKHDAGGYRVVTREWKSGDQIALRLPLPIRVITGTHRNDGKVALMYGPLVLAADEATLDHEANPAHALRALAAKGKSLSALRPQVESSPDALGSGPGAPVVRIRVVIRKPAGSRGAERSREVRLVPFAQAGATGSLFKVWLPLPQLEFSGNLLANGQESRSRSGTSSGSILDDDYRPAFSTLSKKSAEADWFAVTLADPVTITRVVFAHGLTSTNGGWFDAAAGKPRVQARTAKDVDWETIGELSDYPATTAKNAAGLRGGEKFALRLLFPAKVYGVRVLGKPADGGVTNRAHATCAELQAFDW